MKRKKTAKNREWLERQVADMGEALMRLPADRQDLLDALDGGRVADTPASVKTSRAAPQDVDQPAVYSENNNKPGTVSDIRVVKCNPINSRGRGKKRR